jgi:hypothetical protein
MSALSFTTVVRNRYTIIASLPSEDYPPANVASMIKQCEAVGRKDLADQIKMQWIKVLNKYPNTRLNWPTAVAIGGNSIKKNIFGGREFAVWLKEQVDLSPEQKADAQSVPTILPPPKGTPAIAIPKKDETPEAWQEEAAKTKEAYIAARKAFGDVKDYIAYLEKEAADLKKKIRTYGPGGEKEKTKTGEPSKYAARIPKWEEMLKAAVAMIDEAKSGIKEAETSFKEAVNNYNNAPVTTVAFERKAQDSLDNILNYILDMKDLDKQKALLEKLNAAMSEKTKTTASAEVLAGDRIATLFQRVKDGFKALFAWIKGLKSSVNSFGKLAAIRY